MLTVHRLNNSRSQRGLCLLEEFGKPFGIKHYQRDPTVMLAPPERKAVHHLGKTPGITLDGGVMAETGAIDDDIVARLGGISLPPP